MVVLRPHRTMYAGITGDGQTNAKRKIVFLAYCASSVHCNDKDPLRAPNGHQHQRLEYSSREKENLEDLAVQILRGNGFLRHFAQSYIFMRGFSTRLSGS